MGRTLGTRISPELKQIAEQSWGATLAGRLTPEVYALAAQVSPAPPRFSSILTSRDLRRLQAASPTIAGDYLRRNGKPLRLDPRAFDTGLMPATRYLELTRMVETRWGINPQKMSNVQQAGLATVNLRRFRTPRGIASSLLDLRTIQGLTSPRPFMLNEPIASREHRRGIEAKPATSVLPAQARPGRPRLTPPRETTHRPTYDVAPVAAGFFAGRNRQLVVAFLSAAGLESERRHLEAIEERLRAGHEPARNHAAVSARQLLLGVANHCFPARKEPHQGRFGLRHEVGAEDVSNRISAFVDLRLRSSLNAHEHKLFQASLDYVFRWGGRGTHENCTPAEAAQAFLRLLEVLAMVARADQSRLG